MTPSEEGSGDFKIGDLVLIGGLKSDVGKKLNGKHGVILCNKKDGRYIVRMYKSGEHPRGEGWDDTVVEKSFKANNVHKFVYPDGDATSAASTVCKRCGQSRVGVGVGGGGNDGGVCRVPHRKQITPVCMAMIMSPATGESGQLPTTYMCHTCYGRFDMRSLEGTTMMDGFVGGRCHRNPEDISNIIKGRKYCFEGPHKFD